MAIRRTAQRAVPTMKSSACVDRCGTPALPVVSIPVKSRLLAIALWFALSFPSGLSLAQTAPDMPAADSSSLDFKQWGLLAIQDGGRRKPVDTFAREALIKITRSLDLHRQRQEMAGDRFRSLDAARYPRLEKPADDPGLARRIETDAQITGAAASLFLLTTDRAARAEPAGRRGPRASQSREASLASSK